MKEGAYFELQEEQCSRMWAQERMAAPEAHAASTM